MTHSVPHGDILASARATFRKVWWLQAIAGVGLALTAWSGASALWALHANVGPPAQTVNVRWAPTVSVADRQRAEAELGLAEALDEGGAPGLIYRLSRRSSSDVQRIVSHPLVEDTHHINRGALRVELDQPGMNAWLRRLLETDQAPLIGWGLIVCGLLPLWRFRRGLGHAAADIGSVFSWAAVSADAYLTRQARNQLVAGQAVPQTLPLSRAEILGGLLFGVAFLLPLLAYGPFDDEELGLGIFSSQIHYRALFNGQWLFWLDALGFGTPMPIGQRLDLHPVFALGSLVSLRVAMSAVWVTHVALMVVYFQRLAAVSGIRPLLRTILLACYLFSAPSLSYFYGSDWVSVIVGWSLYPALIFYVRQLVRGEAQSRFWTASLRLALLSAFWMLNSHPGYLVALACVLGVYVVALAPRTRGYACLAVAGVLALAMSAERVYFSISEMRMFPPSLFREMQGGYSLRDYAAASFFPLSSLSRGLRDPFIGLIGLCAVVAVPSFLKGRDAHARACGLAFSAAVLLSMAPYALLLSLRVFSGIWLFRDPMVLFGLLAGGIMLERALETASSRRALAGRMLLVMQFGQQSFLLWTAVSGFLAQPGYLQFYRHQGRPFGLTRLLAGQARTFGSRLYVSEEVRTRLRGRMSADGIHVISDLAFLGLDPINAWFKGVSMDRLYPSWALMHGLIKGESDVIENRALLDVLGVNLVLMAEREGPAPPGLQVVDRYRSSSDIGTLLVLANPHAWPRAVLTDIETRDLRLPLRPGCPNRGALCRDYDRLVETRLSEPVQLEGRDGSYVARFAPSNRERLLFMSTMFRPEFVARSAGLSLRVEPVAEAFLGIAIPKGVAEVEVVFTPTARIVLTWFSGVSLMASLAVLSVVWWRHRDGSIG